VNSFWLPLVYLMHSPPNLPEGRLNVTLMGDPGGRPGSNQQVRAPDGPANGTAKRHVPRRSGTATCAYDFTALRPPPSA
jgi:hypothetical protein